MCILLKETVFHCWMTLVQHMHCIALQCFIFFHQPAKHQSIDCFFIGQIIMSQATACRGQDTPAGMSTVLQTAALSQATGPILETCWYCWYCLLPALSSPHSFHGTHSSHIHIGETVRGEAGIPTDSYSPCHWLVRVNPWPTCLLLASWFHEKIGGDPNGSNLSRLDTFVKGGFYRMEGGRDWEHEAGCSKHRNVYSIRSIHQHTRYV